MGNVPPDPRGGIVAGSNLKWTRGEWKEEVVEREVRKRKAGFG